MCRFRPICAASGNTDERREPSFPEGEEEGEKDIIVALSSAVSFAFSRLSLYHNVSSFYCTVDGQFSFDFWQLFFFLPDIFSS